MNDYICPGCRVNDGWEHKCHNICPGEDHSTRCTCEECEEIEVQARFLMTFSEKEQKIVFDFMKFREKIMEKK
jgi:hypothetical protein